MPVLVLAAVLTVLTTTACGPDLSRQNFPRTTVTASAVPDGPITDPAVSFASLRTVDPCALLDARTLADLGTIQADSLDPGSLGECSVHVTDAGGKDLSLRLELADITLNTSAASGAIGGLPLLVDGPHATSCNVTGVTSRSPGYGIDLSADYAGGDPCQAAQTGLQGVLDRLHGSPAKLPQPPGSLLAVDFCAVADAGALADVLGRGSDPAVYGLHGCTWSGGVATAYLDYDVKTLPDASDGTAVDLGNGITGYQKPDNGAGRACTLEWSHRPTGNGEGEVVTFQYENYHKDAGDDDACGKGVTVAKTLIPRLPHA